jgi:hypothetical protein
MIILEVTLQNHQPVIVLARWTVYADLRQRSWPIATVAGSSAI